jgi:hypothetical protein
VKKNDNFDLMKAIVEENIFISIRAQKSFLVQNLAKVFMIA